MHLPTIEELREWRERLGITQKRAATAIGIKQPYLARIEKGGCEPGYSLIRKLISFYESVENTPKETLSKYFNDSVVYVDPDDLVSEAVRKMRRNGYSQMPVFSKGKNVGSISEALVCKAELKSGKEHVLEMKVREIMGPIFPEMDVNTPVDLASQILTGTDLIIVRKNEKIVGVLTKSDLI